MVAGVLDELAEREALEQRLDRAHERGPFRLVGRLVAEVHLQGLLRRGQGRHQRLGEVFGPGLDDEEQRQRCVLGDLVP